jgi:hypothetical protein
VVDIELACFRRRLALFRDREHLEHDFAARSKCFDAIADADAVARPHYDTVDLDVPAGTRIGRQRS